MAPFVNHRQPRTGFESDTSRSALSTGIGLYAPKRPLVPGSSNGEMEVVEGGHRAAAGLTRGNLIEYFVLAPQRANYPQ